MKVLILQAVMLLQWLSTASKVIELPLKRTRVDHPRLLQSSQYSSIGTFQHNVANHDNYAYSTTLYIGSERQPLNLILDSGSSIMWVQAAECPNPSQCHGESPFEDTKSTSYVKTELVQTINYGIGKVVGYVVKDQVAWEPTPLPSQVSDEVRFLLIYEAENLNTLK